MKLIFATNNANKVKEIKALVGERFDILSLKEINCLDDLPETQDTLEGNAMQKARYVADKFNVNCFADDTGLEVDALDGAPGVYSARYAGEDCIAENNMNKLLSEMDGVENRKANFRTCIALIIDGQEHIFDGEVQGKITQHKSGEEGFGYDPIFQPEGYEQTFSEMTLEAKNKISHRGRAVRKLAEYLNSIS